MNICSTNGFGNVNLGAIIPNLRQIVCTFDFNEESRSALIIAGDLALRSSAHLHVVHLVPYHTLYGGLLMMNQPMVYSIYYDDLHDEGYKKVLEQAIMLSVPKNVKVSIHIFLGARVHQLMNFLQESQADLLVMGCVKKLSWWEKIFLPSLPQRIIPIAPCPVLVIPTHPIQGVSYAGSA
jgi:nucleotide-binding universal stress UspA family protein